MTLFLPKKYGFQAIAVVLFLAWSQGVFAQKSGAQFGIGFQAGDPTGLSLQFYKPGGVTADILLSWQSNNYFFANVHALWDKGIDRSGHLRFYYGPGAFIQFREHNKHFDDDNEVIVGLSGSFGLSVRLGRFDIFGQLNPRLALSPGTNFDLGGGVGAHFFF